jgi:hypothetical protein
VFVKQPPGFENSKYPNHVYKLLKALYVLKQTPRAWYARLKSFLLEHEYVMGSVDKTLFTLKYGNDFLLVQIYMDDIIFGGSSHSIVSNFQAIMENEFQMSMMEELTFFLGIQVKQINEGTFVHQAKYTNDLIKKFVMADAKPVSTPMSMMTELDSDEDGEAVDEREYMSMIGSLSCTSRRHGQTSSSLCACVHAFRLPHTLRIVKQFSESSSISNKLLNLGFGILLLLHLILLAFRMLILLEVVLTERALLVRVIFSNPLLFACLLGNNLQLLNPP